MAVEDRAFDPGRAGASARREGERRRHQREERVRSAHPHIGGLLLAVTDVPRREQAWDRGAAGEEHVQRLLEKRCPDIPVLHDRSIPGRRSNIDHIAVTADGVWVIDTKRYAGRIEVRGFGRSQRLFVGGRDQAELLAGVRAQAALVSSVLDADVTHLPVHACLCFVDPNVGLLTSPFTIQGCLVTWPKRLARELSKPGHLSGDEQAALACRLSRAFPSA